MRIDAFINTVTEKRNIRDAIRVRINRRVPEGSKWDMDMAVDYMTGDLLLAAQIYEDIKAFTYPKSEEQK